MVSAKTIFVEEDVLGPEEVSGLPKLSLDASVLASSKTSAFSFNFFLVLIYIFNVLNVINYFKYNR